MRDGTKPEEKANILCKGKRRGTNELPRSGSYDIYKHCGFEGTAGGIWWREMSASACYPPHQNSRDQTNTGGGGEGGRVGGGLSSSRRLSSSAGSSSAWNFTRRKAKIKK